MSREGKVEARLEKEEKVAAKGIKLGAVKTQKVSHNFFLATWKGKINFWEGQNISVDNSFKLVMLLEISRNFFFHSKK